MDRVKTTRFRSLLVHEYNFKSQCFNKSIINVTETIKNQKLTMISAASSIDMICTYAFDFKITCMLPK